MSDTPKENSQQFDAFEKLRAHFQGRPDEFEYEPHEKGRGFFVKAKEAIGAVASKGITGKRVEPEILEIREAQCRGCPALKDSKTGPWKVCGECGCPEAEMNALFRDDGEYSKLMYPKLSCPRRRPGFSNAVDAWIQVRGPGERVELDLDNVLPSPFIFQWRGGEDKTVLGRAIKERLEDFGRRMKYSTLVTVGSFKPSQGWHLKLYAGLEELPKRWDLVILEGAVEGDLVQGSVYTLKEIRDIKAFIIHNRVYEDLVDELEAATVDGAVLDGAFLEEVASMYGWRVLVMSGGILE